MHRAAGIKRQLFQAARPQSAKGRDNYSQQVKIVIIKGEGMKTFFALCLVLVLVLAIALPTAVLASGITAGVSGDVPPVPVLTSISTTNGTPHATSVGTSVDISETLTGSSFDTDPTAVVTVTITGVGVTADTVVVSNSTTISAIFHLAAGPATTSGVRNVYVHQSGRDSVDIVHFTVNGYIVVTAPSAVTLGVMTYGSNTTGQSATQGSVETNDSTNSILADDLKGTASGYMNTAADGSGTSLSHEFQISKDGTTYANADSGAGITYSNVANAGTLSFYVKQQVASPDTVGSYQITITFTGSVQ
jgi:hypothetical protein